MASEQPATRPPQVVAGLRGNADLTNLAPFDVPSFDEPICESTGAEPCCNPQEAVTKPPTTATKAQANAYKQGDSTARSAADTGGKRARLSPRSPALSLRPAGQRMSYGKKKRAALTHPHVSMASQPMEQATIALTSESKAGEEEQPAVDDDATAGDATADAAVPSTPPSTATAACSCCSAST